MAAQTPLYIKDIQGRRRLAGGHSPRSGLHRAVDFDQNDVRPFLSNWRGVQRSGPAATVFSPIKKLTTANYTDPIAFGKGEAKLDGGSRESWNSGNEENIHADHHRR